MYYQSQLKFLLNRENPDNVFSAVDPLPCRGAAGLTWLLLKGLEEDVQSYGLCQQDSRVYDLMATELKNGSCELTERILDLCPSYREFLPRNDESLWGYAAGAGNVAGLDVLNRYRVSDVVGENNGLSHAVKSIRPGAVLYLCTRRECSSGDFLDALELAAQTLEDVRLYESLMGERMVLVLLLSMAKFHPEAMKLLDECEQVEDYCRLEDMGRLLEQLTQGQAPSNVFLNLLDHITGANGDAAAEVLLDLFRYEQDHPQTAPLSICHVKLHEDCKYIWCENIQEEERTAVQEALWDEGRFSCLDGLKILKLTTELSRTGHDHNDLVRLTGTICALKALHVPFPYQTYELIVNNQF